MTFTPFFNRPQHRRLPVFVVLAACVLIAGQVYAHHSAAGYNMSGTATVSGVVRDLVWRNPHVIVRLEVEDEDGNKTIWPLETAGLRQLIDGGWNKDVLAPGQRITAEIRPTIKGVPGGVLRWVTLEDGSVLGIDRASPTGVQVAYAEVATVATEGPASGMALRERAALSRADHMARRVAVARLEAEIRPLSLPLRADTGQAGALDPENIAAHEGQALYDFSGVWSMRSSREQSARRGGKPWHFLPVPELTEKSKAIEADVLGRRATGDATADPATLCYPHGLPRNITRIGNMMLLQQPTAIFMVHRMNNYFRAIYMDGRDHEDPSIRIDSYSGDSIAFWEEDALYIETVGFGQKFHYINEGIPIGKQGKIVERWRLINGGNTLEIELRMTDPEHWVGEWVDTKHWDRIMEADIKEASCISAEDSDLAIGGE